MKLNTFQWLWILAALAFIVAVILHIAEVIQIPIAILMVAALLVFFLGRTLRPSTDETKKDDRRG